MDFKQMKTELSLIMNGDPALKMAMRQVNKMDMVKASLIIRNPKHQEIKIDEILEGKLAKDVPVMDYIFIQNYCELVNEAYNNLEIGNFMDRKLIRKAYSILNEGDGVEFRSDNPVIYSFGHVPPDSSVIEEELTRMFYDIYRGGVENDIALRAMYMHNSIIRIWPFDELNGEIAIFAMNYYLLEQGLMPIDMPMQRQEYLDMVTSALRGTDNDEAYEFFRYAIYKKMENTLKVCRGYLK